LFEKIKVNQYLTNNQIESFTIDSSKKLIKEKILILLSYKPRSKAEIYKRLLNYNFITDHIDEVIIEFEQKGYIDDFAYAETLAKYLIKEKKFGRMVVSSKLAEHKIPRHKIEYIINKMYAIYEPHDLINSILKKKNYNNNLEHKIKQKIIQHIKRKGFLWDEISSALDYYNILD
tara:strand:- start:428 stop:952 length:525 start_codon:yes stop_codon:yes gene_type:complete